MVGSRRAAALVLSASLLALSCGLVRRVHDPAAPAVVDLNTAPRREIEQLPGITPSMASRIVAARPYDDPRALVERGLLTEREFERVRDRIVVQPPKD